MESRKIQKVSEGTYTVSLPRQWAKSVGLTKGSQVDLRTNPDGLVVIHPPNLSEDSPTEVSVSVDHDECAPLEQDLRAAYAEGSEAVTFDAKTAFTPAQRRVINRTARNLTGVSVIQESESRIRVRTLLDSENVSVDQLLRELKFTALSMHRAATESIADPASPNRISERDNQADRLYALIDRVFARTLRRLEGLGERNHSLPELFEYRVISRELERIADHAETLLTASQTAAPLDDSTADDVQAIAETTREIVDDAVSVTLNDGDADTARAALGARDRVCDELDAVRPDGDEAVPPFRHTLLAKLRRTAEHGGNIAELSLGRTIRQRDLAADSDG